jgi:hypothetical protein
VKLKKPSRETKREQVEKTGNRRRPRADTFRVVKNVQHNRKIGQSKDLKCSLDLATWV